MERAAMTTKLFAITLAFAAATLHAERDAAACDRAASPLETPAVGLAVADVVVVADVTQIDKRDAKLRVTAVLKGTVADGDSLDVTGIIDEQLMERCSGNPIGSGKRYLFQLWKPAGALKRYGLVDEHAGVVAHTPAVETIWRDEMAKQHPRSGWQSNPSGLAAQLVVSPRAPAAKHDVDLFVVVRNTRDKPVTLDRKSWPRATMSHCKFDIVNVATKQKLVAKAVPIAKTEIAKYFSKHPRKYLEKLAPGDSAIIHLPRVTTAAAGWGYKEELGFVFYPVATAGDHTLAATCWNFIGRSSKIGTGSITLPLSL